MINETQVQMARTLAQRLAAIPGVESAKVDDWSDWGLFSIFVGMKGERFGGGFIPQGESLAMSRDKRSRSAVRRIASQVQRICLLAREAEEIYAIESITPPRGKYHKVYYRSVFDGYESGDIHVQVRIPEEYPVEKKT